MIETETGYNSGFLELGYSTKIGKCKYCGEKIVQKVGDDSEQNNTCGNCAFERETR